MAGMRQGPGGHCIAMPNMPESNGVHGMSDATNGMETNRGVGNVSHHFSQNETAIERF